MKPSAQIKIQKTLLFDALKNASRTHLCTSQCVKREIPIIFSCFIFEPRRSEIEVSTSDYESFTSIPVPTLSRKGDPGKFAIMIEDLLPIMRKLDDQELTIDVYEYQVTFRHSFGKFSVPMVTESIDFFFQRRGLLESCKTNHALEVEIPFFRSMLDRLCKYTAQDEFRPAMNGISVKRRAGKVEYTASNGHRLMLISKQDQDCTFESSLIIPNKIIDALRRTLPSTGFLTLKYSGPQEDDKEKQICRIWVEDGFNLLFFCPQNKYPDYNKIIPQWGQHKITVGRKALVDSLNRISLFANLHKIILGKVTKGQMQMLACDKDFQLEASETIPCEYNGSSFSVGIKIGNMLPILSSIRSKDVRIQVGGNDQAIVITPDVQPDNETITTIFMPCSFIDEEDFKLPKIKKIEQ